MSARRPLNRARVRRHAARRTSQRKSCAVREASGVSTSASEVGNPRLPQRFPRDTEQDPRVYLALEHLQSGSMAKCSNQLIVENAHDIAPV
jgi:hypothetical protein